MLRVFSGIQATKLVDDLAHGRKKNRHAVRYANHIHQF